jgi:hypothetical protein
MSATSAMSIDSKNLLSIQQLVPRTVGPNTEDALENALLLQLARNVTATEIDACSNELFVDISLNSASFQPTHVLMNNTTIETPNFAFTSTFTDVSNDLLDSTTVNLDLSHNGVPKMVQVLPNSSSYFDSHLKLEVSDNMVFYDKVNPDNKNWTATFAYDDNYNFLKAINSDLNTVGGEKPLKIKEDNDFNTKYALGQDMYKFYTLDSTTGKPVVNPIADLSNVLLENQFSIINTDLTVYEDKYMGTYKIEQTEDTPIITVDPSGTLRQSPLYNNYQPGHGTVTALDASGLPISINYDEFMQLFNVDENTKILPEYKAIFTVDASNGGYKFADENNDQYVSIDDSALVDNQKYMEFAVQHNHKLIKVNNTGILEFSANIVNTSTNATNIANNLPTLNADASNIQYFSRSSYGEKLGSKPLVDLSGSTVPSNSQVNLDGQIVLNKQTESTRIIDQDLSANLSNVHVYNIGETPIDLNGDTLNDADSTSRFVKYDVQNVLKLSGNNTNSYNSLYDSNGASMFFLDKGGYIPPTQDVSFTSLVAPVDGDAEFLKITSNMVLASQDPVVGSNNVIVDNLQGYAYATNINLSKVNFSKYHIEAKQKNLADIDLLSNANGWELIMDNTHQNNSVTSSGSFLTSDSGTVNNTNMPVNAQEIVALNSSCSFFMKYEADGESITLTNDYINIFYDVNGVQQVITIPNNQIHKFFDGAPVKVISPDYDVSGNFNGSVIGIKKQTLTQNFRAKIMLPIQPYNNIVAITPMIEAVITSYKAYNITDPANPIPVPDAVIAKLYQAINGAPYNGSFNASMTVQPKNPGTTSLVCEGLIEAKDLKPWNLQMMGFDVANNVYVPVSDVVDGDVFYESVSLLELEDRFEIDPNNTNTLGDVTTTADVIVSFSLTEIPDYESTQDLFLQLPSYKLNFTNAAGVPQFMVNNLTYNSTNLHDSPIVEAGHLTANFDNIRDLITGNAYIAKVTYEDAPVSGNPSNEVSDGINSTVVLTISQNNVDHYVIKISEKIVTDMIIYKNTMDWYRIVKMIGEDATDGSHNKTTTFVQTNYPFMYQSTSSAFKVDNGIYIEGSNSSVNSGDRAVFRLKNVEMSVNTLGRARPQLTELYNQVDFVVKDPETGDPVTETITINRYRNFYGLVGVNHQYTFRRVPMDLRIEIRNQTNTLITSQTFANDLRYAQTYTVSNLNNQYRNIGLKFTPNYSIFPGNAPTTMDITVTGDPISINIRNPLQTVEDNYPFDSNKTLKDWDIYKFSGGVLNMAARRVKLKNAAFTDASFSYELYLEPRKVLVSHSPKYIGNPIDHTDYLDMAGRFNDPAYPSDFTYYEAINDANGVKIPGYIFKRDSTLATRKTVSYVVVAPPFLSFEHMRDLNNAHHITQLPYVYNNHADNVIKFYLPVVDANVYNPFDVSNIFNTNVIGQNNVTFVREAKAFYLYDTVPVSLYEIIVLGNSVKIEEYFGLKNVASPQFLTTLYNGRINDLVNESNGEPFRFVSNINQNYIVKYQQNLGNFLNNTAVENILGNNGNAFNISFAIGNAFMNNGVYYLDLESGQGTNVEFLSCSTVLDASGDLVLLFEKYSTDAPFDYSNLPLDTLRRISFMINKKEKKIVKLPPINFGMDAYNLEKSRRAITMLDVNGPWTNVPLANNFAFNFNIVALSQIGVQKMLEIFATSPTSPFKANYVTMKDLITMTSADGSTVYRVKYNGGVVSMYGSNAEQYINKTSIFDSKQDSSNEYVAYNVNHFASLI